MQSAELSLTGFFDPIENSLQATREQAKLGFFDALTPELMNIYFGTMIKNHPQMSSMGIARMDGYEYDVLPGRSGFDNRVVHIDEWGMLEHWSNWQVLPDSGKCVKINEWEKPAPHDPRERPWFIGAMKSKEPAINWTKPYVYNTTLEVGMTASLKWRSPADDELQVLAFDLTLSDISKFTQQLNVSPNGKIFVLSNEGRYIGLPNDSIIEQMSIDKAILAHVDSLGIDEIANAYINWKGTAEKTRSAFEYQNGEEYWWGKMMVHKLSPGNSLIVGVVIPEKDILSEVERTKRVIIGGIVIVLVLIAFIMYAYAQLQKSNKILEKKNNEISEQKRLIQLKNQEIYDSISYAKNIQSAILPSISEVKKLLPDSFIFYKPKDIVAGDFYWLEHEQNKILFAAADCTGHGVPGALVSVLCKNGLSRAVREYNETVPGAILDLTAKIIMEQFEKSKQEINDGMDIALCSLQDNKLQYAGANNSLWIIRQGAEDIEEIKADKQPVGRFENIKPFTTHTIELNKGDTFYLFSDGFADQFGGEDGKKYKPARLRKLLLKIKNEEMNKQRELLEHEFNSWKGELEQLDDVCVMGVRY